MGHLPFALRALSASSQIVTLELDFFGFPLHLEEFSMAQALCLEALKSILIIYRIAEWFGLERTLKITQFQLPAMGRDTSH